jgi:hypothetical protein
MALGDSDGSLLIAGNGHESPFPGHLHLATLLRHARRKGDSSFK